MRAAPWLAYPVNRRVNRAVANSVPAIVAVFVDLIQPLSER